eukprot:5241623-Pleurochrysis_carterae.AAC.1
MATNTLGKGWVAVGDALKLARRPTPRVLHVPVPFVWVQNSPREVFGLITLIIGGPHKFERAGGEQGASAFSALVVRSIRYADHPPLTPD